MSEWILVIPAPCEWLTANDLLGRHDRFSRTRITAAWRGAACTCAHAANLPVGLDRVRIDAHAVFFGKAPVRDRDNLRPTVKAAIDGLGQAKTFVRKGVTFRSPGYGLIPDDSDRYLVGTDITVERLPARPYGPVGQLVLTIREVT